MESENTSHISMPSVMCSIHRKKKIEYVCTEKECAKRILCPNCILDPQANLKYIVSLESFIEEHSHYANFESKRAIIKQEYETKLNQAVKTTSESLDRLLQEFAEQINIQKAKIEHDKLFCLESLDQSLSQFSSLSA